MRLQQAKRHINRVVRAIRYTLPATRYSRGTTLVELLVALSIFAIFISVAIGGFVQSLANQRVVLKLVAATDNASLTLEEIMREIRIGTNFVTNGPQSITFDRPDSENGLSVMRCVTYSLQPFQNNPNQFAVQRSLSTQNSDGSCGTPTIQLITANNVNVSYFNITASKSTQGPGPCRIGMTVGVQATDRGVSITDYIQTTASSRLFASTCQ